jgi:hypothetical protein
MALIGLLLADQLQDGDLRQIAELVLQARFSSPDDLANL